MTKDPVLDMIQHLQEVRDTASAKIDAMDNCPDETFDALIDPTIEMEREIFLTPATTVSGVLAKLRIHFQNVTMCDLDEQPCAEMPLDQLGTLSVLRDLEHLAD